MFKYIRSFIGKLFPENIQMVIIVFLSDLFRKLRKYFLSVVIDYPKEFLINWQSIKKNSSQDKERNFTIYQVIKLHNEIFKDKETGVIEFGVDRGGTITTISKFIKPKTKIYALDSFGIYADNIKKMFQISMNIIRDLINHLQNKLDLKILTIRIWKLI